MAKMAAPFAAHALVCFAATTGAAEMTLLEAGNRLAEVVEMDRQRICEDPMCEDPMCVERREALAAWREAVKQDDDGK